MERGTAIHTWVKEILSGSLIQQEDTPSSIALADGSILDRIRIYGIIVSTQDLVVDDGTGSILVRSFEDPFNIQLGDPVVIIGKPRIYNDQHYVLGEIVKKIDSKWLEVRNKQHSKPKETEKTDPLSVVRNLDNGDGADYNEVIESIGQKGEETVLHLLAIGELFETKPGKLKVLE